MNFGEQFFKERAFLVPRKAIIPYWRTSFLLGFLLCFSITTHAVGDIIITEVMQNPSAVSDANGEYFELHNTTGSSIDLLNWVVRDDATASETHTIASSVVVPAGL